MVFLFGFLLVFFGFFVWVRFGFFVWFCFCVSRKDFLIGYFKMWSFVVFWKASFCGLSWGFVMFLFLLLALMMVRLLFLFC